MANELTTATKDVGINANLRPNSLDVRGQQPNLFPTDAFVFDDPNRVDSPVLSMKEPWSLDIGQINFDDLDTSLSGTLETNLLKVEEHSDYIKKVDRGLNLTSQTVYDNGVTATAGIEIATGIAEDAQTDASDALTLLGDMADDEIITPTEKIDLKLGWDIIVEEKPQIVADALEVDADSTAYVSAYDALDLYLNTTLSIFSDMTSNTVIDKTTWDTTWTNYYTERSALNGDSSSTIFAEVGLKAEIKDSSGESVSGAYLTVRADYPVGGGEATSYIEFNADQIRFGGSGLGLDDITEDDGTEVFIKGDLRILSDTNDRLIHLGSTGIYAEDSAGSVLHDIPDELLTGGYTNAGHLYYADATEASFKIYNGYNLAPGTTVDVTCNVFGNTNVNAVLLGYHIRNDFEESYNGYRTVSTATSFKPKDGWAGASYTPTVGEISFTYSNGYGGIPYNISTGNIVVPLGTDNKISFTTPSSSYSDKYDIFLYQYGIYI